MEKEQAIQMYNSGWWIGMPEKEVAAFQLFEDLLCMPFGEYHRCVEVALGRPVYTHEFRLNVDGLKKELLGEASPPSLEEILAMLPADKTVVVIAS